MKHRKPLPLSLRGLSWLALPALAGCVGQSANCPCVETGATAAGTAPGAAAVAGCDGQAVPAADGLLDDFEDDASQVVPLDGRDGYWWKHADPNGSKFTEPAEGANLKAVDGGANGTAKALMVAGSTAGGQEAYGIEVGTNLFSAKGETYDATKYVGVSFWAKVGADSIKKVRFNVSDVNTHQDPGVCKNCWNHFRKDFTLTTEWQEYTATFEELRQRDGWGDPRPKAVTPGQIYTVTFAMEGGGPFELYVDEIQFLECKK